MTLRRATAVALVAAGGIALRVWVYRSALGAPDSDEAIVGLMARHVLHGQLTTFYWGQPYGGTQEVLLTAPVFAAAGSGLLTLRVVTLALTAAGAALVWLVGLRTVGRRAAGVAAALFWLWPPYDVMWLVHERGFYASDVVYCLLLLLLGLRLAERPEPRRAAALGLVLGLAFWQTAQVVPIAVPVVAWVAWRAPRAVRHAPAALLAAVVGALPWLVWNVRHHWASILPRADAHQYVHSLRLFASPLLPMALGLRAPLTGQALLPGPLLYAVYAALLCLFAYGAFRTRRSDVSLLYLVASAFPLVWAVARRVGFETSQPLFLVVLTPVLVLLLAQLARTRAAAAALLVAACAVTAVTLQRMEAWLTADRPHFPPRTPRSLAPLVAELDRLGIDRVYANYWIAYRLTFATGERIVAAQNDLTSGTLRGGEPVPAGDPRLARYVPYQREVARAPHAFVLFRADTVGNRFVSLVRRAGYRRVTVGPFAIFTPRH